MKSIKTSMGNIKDEWVTPEILIKPLLKYITSENKILCPFDKEESPYVKVFRENGNDVFHAHIDDGMDFFNCDKPLVDFIISNPPFSKKLDVFDTLFKIDIPFAMLMNIECLNYQEVGNFFYQKQNEGKELQLLIFDKKVSFDGNTSSFNSSYFCYKFLPQQIIFEHLEHNNSGKFFGKEF